MTKTEYNKLKKQIDRLLKKAEDEALEEGIDISSSDFEEIVLMLKKGVLSNKGLTLEQYEELQKNIEEEKEIGAEDISLRLLAVNLRKDQKKLSEVIKAFEEEPTKKTIKELRETINQIQRGQLTENAIKKLIPKIPQIKYYDSDIKEIKERIDQIIIPEQIDNSEEIENLKWQVYDDIEVVKKKIPKVKNWSPELKKLEKELKKYVDMAAIPRGRVSDKGGRFHNWGMPDKGSYGTAITDSRYYQKSEVDALISAVGGGTGDVVGPASATDNAIARFDTTTGKLIQNSVVTIADTTGNMAGVGTLGCGAITSSGTLALGANSITMTGSLGATGARVTKGWFADLEVTNDITINGTALAATYAAIAQTMYIGTTGVAINRGSGALTLAGITLTTPDIGTPSAGTLTNCSGLPAANVVAGSLVANMLASDHGTAATDQIINVCYGTADPPAAATTTEGTLFVKYTA